MPVPRVVPIKQPCITVPLVRRVRTNIPVKLSAHSKGMTSGSARIKLKSSKPQISKTELTESKSNIDALLGHLAQIIEGQKANPDERRKVTTSVAVVVALTVAMVVVAMLVAVAITVAVAVVVEVAVAAAPASAGHSHP